MDSISTDNRPAMTIESIDQNKWFIGVTPIARRHLLNSMSSLKAGRAPTPSFKLYGKKDWSLVEDFFAQIKQTGLRIPEWQLEYEMSRKKKFGPQGGYASWSELLPEFELYYSNPKECSAEVCLSTLDKYSKLNCRLPSYQSLFKFLIDDDKIQNRASGWRDFNLKKTSQVAQHHALQDVKSGNWRNGYGYVFSRFNKQKKRIFFPMPYSDMLLEAQYYYPFLKAIQNDLTVNSYRSEFTFWADKLGFDKMFNNIVTPLCKGYDRKHLVYVQRDFYHMDTTQGFAQTRVSLIPKLRAAFALSAKELVKVQEILYFGATCPIFTPDGVYKGYRGKASGANTTNGDETCSNEDYDNLMQTYLQAKCRKAKIEYKVLYSGGNGDDGMLILYLKDNRRYKTFTKLIQEAAEEAARVYGYIINDKWFISQSYGLYCQRMITADDERIVDMYPASLILNSIINPEREYNKSDWDKDYRDLDIIEKLDNGKNLPYYHQLIDFVDNGMKFRLLGRSENETFRILSKYERYRALREDPFNYQDAQILGDISKSPTVQYLLEKRGIQLGK